MVRMCVSVCVYMFVERMCVYNITRIKTFPKK